MARRRLEGLERVLGVNALFSTAYGNVGSSIYYALGLVAALALGLTPLVFLITGFFFLCTAATYAEATAMYPEAGGSSSFARRAFNEFWSFFAAWGQMLNYVVTVAISAFFVPHYLGSAFGWEALRHSPGDIIAGAIIIAALSAINVVGVKESAGLNIVLAVVDFLTQVLLVIIGAVLVLGADPGQLVDNVTLGVAPTWKDFILAIPIGMIAYTGIETISNMAEEAKDEIKTIPAAIKRVAIAVFAIYFTLPAVALVALPVQQNPETGEYYTLLGLSEEEGGFAGDPIAGVVANLEPGRVPDAGGDLRRHPGRHDPVPGHERGPDRRVPARVLDGHPPPVARSAQTAAPEVPHAVDRHPAVRLPRDPDHAAGGGGLPRQPVRVRRDAVVHDRALGDHPPADLPARPAAALPAPGNWNFRGHDLPMFAFLGGFGTFAALVVTIALHPDVAVTGVAWLTLGVLVFMLLPARAGPGSDLHPQGRDPAAGRRSRGRVRLGARAAERGLQRDRDRHRGQAGGPPPARHPRARDGDRAERAEDRRPDAGGDRGRRDADRAGAAAGGRARVRARRAGASGQAGRRIIEEATDMRAAAIVMPLPRRINGASIFGKTLETVLAERPCRVIIESTPADRRHQELIL